MLNTRARTLAAAVLDGGGWAHPYASPFVLYADGGGDGADGAGRTADDGGDDGGDQDGDGDGDQDGDRDGDDQDDEADKDLGDKGKKALRELRRENRTLKTQLRQQGNRDAAKKPTAKDGDQGDDAPEAIRERAREEARAEVWGERVEAAAVAAAAGRLANPQLAARLLDLSDIGENDKGRPDREAITELIDDLLDEEPYLAVQSAKGDGRRFQGGADGGARKPSKKTAATLGEAVANRLAGKSG